MNDKEDDCKSGRIGRNGSRKNVARTVARRMTQEMWSAGGSGGRSEKAGKTKARKTGNTATYNLRNL